MKVQLSLFFRHPDAIYFSLEKIFRSIGTRIAERSPVLRVTEQVLPFPSKIKTIARNIRFVRRHQTTINHITGDAQYAILGCSGRNVNILTIHDCVLLRRYPPASLKHQVIRWLWYRLPVRKADAVTVISENTRRDLLHFTGCPPEKIHLIPNFLDPLYGPAARRPFPDLPVLLFIGTAPNKNLQRVVQAVETLAVQLLIVGYPDAETCAEMDRKNIRYSTRAALSPEAMRQTYAEADLLVFPSVLEGFGLPIIEAQATGRPVLTSNIEPMTWVAGNAACFVDPFDAGDIRKGIERLLTDQPFREALVTEGFENIKRFGLDEVADGYSKLYEKLLKEKPVKESALQSVQ